MTPAQAYATEIEAERRDWYELAGLLRSLTPAECLVPGYYRDPDWSVRDVAGHLGTWLAEAEIQFERITAGTHEGHDIDIDRRGTTLARYGGGRRLIQAFLGPMCVWPEDDLPTIPPAC